MPAPVLQAINPVTPSFKEIADFCHDGIQYMFLDDLFDTIVLQIWEFLQRWSKLPAPHAANTPAVCSGSPLRAAQPKGCPPGGRCCRMYVTKNPSIELTNRLFHLIQNQDYLWPSPALSSLPLVSASCGANASGFMRGFQPVAI